MDIYSKLFQKFPLDKVLLLQKIINNLDNNTTHILEEDLSIIMRDMILLEEFIPYCKSIGKYINCKFKINEGLVCSIRIDKFPNTRRWIKSFRSTRKNELLLFRFLCSNSNLKEMFSYFSDYDYEETCRYLSILLMNSFSSNSETLSLLWSCFYINYSEYCKVCMKYIGSVVQYNSCSYSREYVIYCYNRFGKIDLTLTPIPETEIYHLGWSDKYKVKNKTVEFEDSWRDVLEESFVKNISVDSVIYSRKSIEDIYYDLIVYNDHN